jgi:tetratricopeptide (TPR) repeat protein
LGACILWLAPAQQLQKPPEDPLLKQVAEMSKRCLAESNQFREQGGKAGDPGDPALNWAPLFWRVRVEHPGTVAADRATRAAFSWWRHADQDQEVMARAEKLPSDDPAWERVIYVFKESARKTEAWKRFTDKAESLLSLLKDKKLRAAVWKELGSAYLSQDKPEQAKAAFQAILNESPGASEAEDAEQFIYEINHLNVGQPAPQFHAQTIDGAPISSQDLRGKVVLLNFWASW